MSCPKLPDFGLTTDQRQRRTMIVPIARNLIAILILVAAVPLGPLHAQTSSEAERLEKLERAVEQLQQRNAELEKEVATLRKKSASSSSVAPADGPMKTRATSDGKTYVEKSVPVEKSSGDKWKLSTPITEIELF